MRDYLACAVFWFIVGVLAGRASVKPHYTYIVRAARNPPEVDARLLFRELRKGK